MEINPHMRLKIEGAEVPANGDTQRDIYIFDTVHDADRGSSTRDGTSNTVMFAEHAPVKNDYSGAHLLYQDVFVTAVQGVGMPTDTDWLLV